jgi:DNA-binding NarL/FixJ family response regulator
MPEDPQNKTLRVLIASNHDLFSHGLRSLLKKRLRAKIDFVGVVSSTTEVIHALQTLHPDLIIIDYDDVTLNREELLVHFVGGVGRSRVILISLSNPEQAMLYDRRELSLSQIENWFEGWQTL